MPVDRGSIDAQLREIGEGERWWEQREFRDLPHILHADERLQGIVRGRLIGRRGPRTPSGRWLFVATNQRLICLKQGGLARKQVEITPGQIMRVIQSNRIGSYQITILTPRRRYRLRIPKSEAFRFAGAIAPLVPNPSAQRLPPPLEPWSWVPGIHAVAALPGVSEIVARVGPQPYAPLEQVQRLEATVEQLQAKVERLQDQVAFLEDLLQKRAEEALLPGSTAES